VRLLESRSRKMAVIDAGDVAGDSPKRFSRRDHNFNEIVVLRVAGRTQRALSAGSQGYGCVETSSQSHCQSGQTYPCPDCSTSPG